MTVQKKILDLTGTQYLVQKITGEIPVKISDLQDDVDILTSHEDLHLENLPNESPNIIFENNTPSYTWREMPHGDLIDWGYFGNPYDQKLTFLTSSSKITYKNNSNSQNTCELAFGQSKVETKTILTMNYYYGSNDTNEPDDDSNYVSSSLVFTLNPGYNNLASSTFDETEYSYSDVSPDCDNYYLGRKNPFKAIYAKDFKFVLGENDFSLITTIEEIGSSLLPHIADTDVHVTTADKNKWNNQTYVFRYSSTALTASSTNSNALLDNTDNLKVGDKVIDASGVLFSITAIDTQNSTFTIGTSLIDLAQDSDVVHKNGDETITGYKTFSYNMTLYNSNESVNPVALFFKNKKVVMGSTTDIGSQNIAFRDSEDTNLSILKTSCESMGNTSFEISVYNKKSNNQTVSGGMLISQTTANTYITPTTDNAVLFGSTDRRWSKIYGTEYYYGSNNVEFSTKFVTTDTEQDITANKNFKGLLTTSGQTLWPINTKTTDDITFLQHTAVHVEQRASGNLLDLSNGAWNIANLGIGCFFFRNNSGTDIRYKNLLANTVNRIYIVSNNNRQLNNVIPETDNTYDLGSSSLRWSTINGLEPSSLGMPDLDNGIDISSYITVNGGNKESLYTPPANGWISVRLSRTSGALGVLLIQGNMASSGKNIEVESGVTTADAMLPVKGGIQVSINSALADGIVSAYFYPCLGNV